VVKDPDHSPKCDHLGVGAVEEGLDRSPKMQRWSYWRRKLSRHSPRPSSATPSRHLKQATPKRLRRATSTWDLRVGKLTRRDYTYSCFIMKQECVAFRRKTPLDNGPVGGLSRPVRTSSFQIVHLQSKIGDGWGQRYYGTTSTKPESYPLDQVHRGKRRPNRAGPPCLEALALLSDDLSRRDHRPAPLGFLA